MFSCVAIPRQLIRQLNGEFLITRHEEMPDAVNLLPPGHGIYGLPLRGMGGLLDRVADFVFDNRADFQDAVRAPLVDQPVEGTELTAADFNLRQGCAVLPDASQPQPFGFFGSVIQCDLTDDIREEVAELLIVTAILCSHLDKQTAVDHLVRMGIVWNAAFVFCHSFTVLTFQSILSNIVDHKFSN